MTLLSININKIATLRNSRGGSEPNLLKFTETLLSKDIKGITIHPRPDERHITKKDAYELSELLEDYPLVEFNIEGRPTEEFLQLVTNIKPSQVTLVPDAPNVLTSNQGWDVFKEEKELNHVINIIRQQAGSRVSLFINPYDYLENGPRALDFIVESRADRVELYTEEYAKSFNLGEKEKEDSLQVFKNFANLCLKRKIGVNAGHDLNAQNLRLFKEHIPHLKEVSIGHAFVRDCLYFGLDNSVHLYQDTLL